MRLTLFLILLNVFGVYARDSFSQNTRFNLDYRNTSIKQILEDIKSQGNLEFFYSNNDFDTSVKVDISIKNGTLKEVLDQIVLPEKLQYRIVDNTVIISDIKKSPERIIQSEERIKGKVTDIQGKPLPGATITVVGTTRGVITDTDGSYSIEANPSDKLVFSFIGMESQIVDVGRQKVINVTMAEKKEELEEVTVVAFGKQKKESVISSIETIKTDELRVPSSNLTTAFAGRMAGVISYQTSGEPGQDNAEFFIRGVTTFGTGKVDPLILLDNVEISSDDLASLHPDDIASFSILKDATATSLYGARGANGVVLITTKEGKEGKPKIDFRFENSFSMPTQQIEMADPITYMKMANEAVLTRNPLGLYLYSDEKIDRTEMGQNPLVYPTVDWMDILFKKVAINQRANLNISGGGTVARYYIAGSISQDNGILNVDNRNNFNNNIDLKKYLLRSNVNIKLSNSTEVIVRLQGRFKDYLGPIDGGTTVYQNALRVSPVRFPPYYEPDESFKDSKHILFGGYDAGQYLNPYAEMVKGYKNESESVVLAQFELEQDFGKWIDGLTGRILGNTVRSSMFNMTRSYNPFYYNVATYDRQKDEYTLTELNPEGGTEYLNYKPGTKKVLNSFYAEGSLSYNKKIKKNSLSGMLVGIIRNEIDGNAGSLSASLPHRNLGLSGRFTYEYDGRYLAEFNFGYNGSEKFDAGHRWGFFPSYGLGWVVSNEPYWTGEISHVISNLKFRATYGLIGNDDIGSERFFYLSRVNMDGGDGYTLGYDFNGRSRQGVSIGNYANSDITWEIAYKSNLGIDMSIFDGKIDVMADIFKERRINILQTRADIPSTMGLWSTPTTNVGKAKGTGFDMSLDFNWFSKNDIWLIARGNFTYARATYEFYEEPDYSVTPWRSRIGMPLSQKWGYQAERLFIDEADVANSPRQDFGEYGAGDIRYKDINDDGVINELDLVPIGYPTTPEINYGLGLSSGYKNFDFSFYFQGSGRSSFWIDAEKMAPFIQSTIDDNDDRILETGLAKFIADDYWSEVNQNPLAGWPRLANYQINNNTQRSTWFMQNGSFLRLKSVEFGYTLPEIVVQNLKIKSCRFYLSGTNLFLLSSFKLWDVEMGGNGLGYPIQKVFNIGVNVTF